MTGATRACAPGRAPDPSGDVGSATIWVVVVVALLGCVTAAGLLVAEVAAARQRAATAADLAALAGAAAAERGLDACAAASTVAAADGAVLAGCTARAEVVAVTARVPVPPAVRAVGIGPVSVQARAGPG